MVRVTESAARKSERFARFARITWWDQQRLAEARVLVVGAGALGNEVVKNLALLGVGHIAIADMDTIEESNLTRSVLFRPGDEGRPKAEVAAEAARAIFPAADAIPLVGNVLSDIGLGWFRWADVIVGALDNREARVFVNSSCAMTGRSWVDGGIEVLNGIVRGFAPPETACYECTMSETDWNLLAKRRSCSLLARRAIDQGGVPTTPTTASVIGAMQAQEVVKQLHGLEFLAGAGFVFEGLSHSSYLVRYSVKADCPWHEVAAEIETMEDLSSQSTLRDVWQRGCERLGELDAIDFAREIVATLRCVRCGTTQEVFQPLDRITEDQAICDRCGTERMPDLVHSLSSGSRSLERTVEQVGLPPWDVMWVRRGDKSLGIELAGDRRRVPTEVRKELRS